MNRPQVINPKTGNVMNLFSEDVEALLDEGYHIKDIFSIILHII